MRGGKAAPDQLRNSQAYGGDFPRPQAAWKPAEPQSVTAFLYPFLGSILGEAEGVWVLENERRAECSLPFNDAGGNKFFNTTPLTRLQTFSLPSSLLTGNVFGSPIGLAKLPVGR